MNKLKWYCYEPFYDNNNIGDIITPFLLKSVFNVDSEYSTDPDIVMVGSLLGRLQPHQKNTKVFGSGLLRTYHRCPVDKNNFFGVRGYLTAELLQLDKEKLTFGDYGLLIDKYYQPTLVEKKYKLGIIPYEERFDEIKQQVSAWNDDSVIVFSKNLKDQTEESIKEFLDLLNQCEKIASCSLHAIVFAHSYGIPAVHLVNSTEKSDRYFKFDDYYSILDIPHTTHSWDKNLKGLVDDADVKYLAPSKECVEEIQNNMIKTFNSYLNNRGD